jgi:hypothetical protein
MTAHGPKLPIRDVRSSVATGGRPDMVQKAESVAFDPSRKSTINMQRGVKFGLVLDRQAQH